MSAAKRVLIDARDQHIEQVTVAADPVSETAAVVRTEHLSIYLPDPIGLWEALSDALRGTEGDHLREYLGGEGK